MKFHKVHFFTFFSYFLKYTLLISIPIIQYVFFRPIDIYYIAINFSFNLIVLYLIIFTCIKKFKNTRFSADDKNIIIKTNWIFKLSKITPKDNFSILSLQKLFLFYNTGKAYKNLILSEDSNNSPESTLFLSKNGVDFFYKGLINSDCSLIYTSSKLKNFLLSILNSNSLTGLFIAVPFLNQIQKIINNSFINDIYSTVSITNKLIKIGVPPLIALISNIIVLAWTAAFLSQLENYYHHKIYSNSDNSFIISHGLINKYLNIINKKKISYIHLKQPILFVFFKIYNCYYGIIGLKRLKSDRGLLLFSEKKNNIYDILKKLDLYKNNKSGFFISPEKSRRQSYCNIYLGLLCFVSFISIISESLVIKYLLLILIFYLSTAIIYTSVMFPKIGITVFKHGIVHTSNLVRFSLNEYYFSKENITKIKISENLIQKFSKTCNVIFYIKSDNHKKIKIKHLKRKNAEALIKKLK